MSRAPLNFWTSGWVAQLITHMWWVLHSGWLVGVKQVVLTWAWVGNCVGCVVVSPCLTYSSSMCPSELCYVAPLVIIKLVGYLHIFVKHVLLIDIFFSNKLWIWEKSKTWSGLRQVQFMSHSIRARLSVRFAHQLALLWESGDDPVVWFIENSSRPQ